MVVNKKKGGNSSSVGTDVVLPKALPKKAKSATPATSTKKGQALRRDTKSSMVNSISDVRGATSDIQGIRLLAKDEGVTSTSIRTAAAIAVTKFKITAYDTNTNTFNGEATQILGGILASMDTLSDYTKKYADKTTVRQFIEMAILELQKTSGIGCELVLNDQRLPESLQLVSYENIEFKSNGQGGRYPIQKVKGGDPIDLNLPNFWIGEINRDPTLAYATPLLRAALNTTITNHEFIEDMRRAVSVTGHSRLVVTLNSEMVTRTASEEIRDDPAKLIEYMNTVQNSMVSSLSGLSPEDSIVVYDNVAVDVADIGGNKADYVPLMKSLNNLQSTALQTPSSILGLRAEGSQSLSNVEALTYIKMLESLRGPVTDVLSRAFTLAVRLYGLDVYAKVTFDPIDLRPENELEAYRTMRNDRYLKNLSLGIWTQQQFCHMSGEPYRPDMPDLSGTMFHEGFKSNKANNNTQLDNSGGAQRALNPDTPKKGGGGSQ